MIKNIMVCSFAMVVAIVATQVTARAQQTTVSLPANAKVVSQINVEGLQKSVFGKKLIELISERALEQIADRLSIAVPDNQDVSNFLGFDLFEELRTITVVGTDLESPENGLLAVVGLKKTVGNIEAILPAHVPGYSVSTVGDYKIHSGSPEGERKIFLAVHTGKDDLKSLVVGTTEESVVAHVTRMDGKASSSADKPYEFKPTSALIQVQALELPSAEKLGDGPQTILLSMTNKISFALDEVDGKLNVVVGFTGVDEENAKQLDEMLQGLVPMVSQAVPDFPVDLEVSRDGGVVSLVASVDAKKASELMSSQFDGAIDQLQGALGGAGAN